MKMKEFGPWNLDPWRPPPLDPPMPPTPPPRYLPSVSRTDSTPKLTAGIYVPVDRIKLVNKTKRDNNYDFTRSTSC